ncbi:MAG: hypothetical protein M0Q40_11840, partial [Limnochordia bacterium]|nr:hypothetical protein [Limnochordia bacterium]
SPEARQPKGLGRTDSCSGRQTYLGKPYTIQVDLVSSNKPKGEEEKKWYRVADKSIVVMNP